MTAVVYVALLINMSDIKYTAVGCSCVVVVFASPANYDSTVLLLDRAMLSVELS